MDKINEAEVVARVGREWIELFRGRRAVEQPGHDETPQGESVLQEGRGSQQMEGQSKQ